MQTLQEIADYIKTVKSAVIFTHARPDGDAIGSAMSLYLALRQMNINCEVVDESDIPEKFYFFTEVAQFKKQPTIDAEAYITVDSADEFRLGALSDKLLSAKNKKTIVNIDHHISNTKFGKMNFVKCCSANCENMTELISLLPVEVTPAIANYLMLGLLTDSGNFSHSDVNERTFATAAFLSACGADVNAINYNIFKKQKKRRALLYAHTLDNIRFALDDRLAITVVGASDLEAYGAKQEDTEGFVDFALTIESVEVSVSIMEYRKGQYKVSFRSKGKTNVNAIASVYGGGGHILASGCMMFGDIEEIIDKLRFTVSQYLVD